MNIYQSDDSFVNGLYNEHLQKAAASPKTEETEQLTKEAARRALEKDPKVSTVTFARAVRESQIQRDIEAVLQYLQEEYQKVTQYGLPPVVPSYEMVEKIIRRK